LSAADKADSLLGVVDSGHLLLLDTKEDKLRIMRVVVVIRKQVPVE
jgi:hypothetical protein